MTPSEFKRRQSALGWTNAKMASHLRKTPQSVSNYRNARQAIPEHVEVLLDAALRNLHDKAVDPSAGPSIGADPKTPSARLALRR